MLGNYLLGNSKGADGGTVIKNVKKVGLLYSWRSTLLQENYQVNSQKGG